MNRRHHAFVIEAGEEEGIKIAEVWVERELGMEIKGNPDVIVLRYGLFSPDDARRVSELAAQAPFAGEHKAIIIAASRAYHEAQNALLKLFEEPSPGTYLFFILPTLGGLLPTLRSRVAILNANVGPPRSHIPEAAEEFLKATKERRSAIIKKLTSGKDELRDEAIGIVNGIEQIAHGRFSKESKDLSIATLLSDIATLRSYLYDRSAPVRMILEHLSLVIPKELQKTVDRKQ